MRTHNVSAKWQTLDEQNKNTHTIWRKSEKKVAMTTKTANASK